jgi:peptidoglycan/LPS O-acetylase OafA/YrhL
MTVQRLAYRPEIDGLRALAVLSVFIFHLNHQWLPGGFVGVDIFFVISGYLITSILYNDCAAGRFSLSRFYQRRIARIFPAFFAVALTTTVVAAFVYSSLDFASVGANLVAASLSVANIKYMLQGNYFEISPDAQPFLHYWSLSVEEQFYVVFPLLLFLLFRYTRRHMTLVLALAGLGSLVACIKFTQSNPVWAFYLLPTRAWELIAGSLLAVMPFTTPTSRHTRVIFRWLPAAGLLLIGGSFVMIHEGPNFPGWRAIFPVAGAVAIIFSLTDVRQVGWVRKLLSSLPMVAIGKISYSLYLWHWPVFSLIDYQFYLASDALRFAMKIGFSFLLAFIGFRYIETPARIFLNQPKHRRIAYATFVTVLALSVGLGFAIRKTQHVNATLADVTNGGLVFSVKPGPTSVVLMGDSNGSMYGTVMKEICGDLGENLTVISVDAGDPLPQRDGNSDKLWLDSLEVVRESMPKYLVMANHWSGKLEGDRERLAKAIAELKPFVEHIVLLNQPPILPKEVNRASFRAGLRPPFREPMDVQGKRRAANDYLLGFQSPGVSVVDIASYFETEDGDIRVTDERGQLLYQDATHLSGHGAERIRAVLKEAISLP